MSENEKHNEKMKRLQTSKQKIFAKKTEKKGLIIVNTGTGKGKSTAAFGMVFRGIAHGMPCAVVQFIKGAMATGERDLIQHHFPELCEFHTLGDGFTWDTQDKEKDIASAKKAWNKAKELISDEKKKIILLDEINIALRYGYVEIDDVLTFLLEKKPKMTHVILTGRNANEKLIGIADLVTDMTLVKHHFRNGVMSQAGIEF
ncbi:cob(I)yrinic acid a,c-diamide adenosyltransferase [Paracoccaceae bacterium]|nr:cob(I)yrinic acid a,c-diamide adenosyltransferase [Paracoccaceae bacterium]